MTMPFGSASRIPLDVVFVVSESFVAASILLEHSVELRNQFKYHLVAQVDVSVWPNHSPEPNRIKELLSRRHCVRYKRLD